MKYFGIVALLACVAFVSTPPTAPSQLPSLENAPIIMVGPELSNGVVIKTIGEVMAGDSLRVVVIWDHPSDGGGLEDSTFFRIKSSNTVRLSNNSTLTPDTWKRRRWSNKTTADTFRVLMPAVGDSIWWKADSITQCRKGDCSIPGGAGWGYRRSAAPPAMTFIKIATDTF